MTDIRKSLLCNLREHNIGNIKYYDSYKYSRMESHSIKIDSEIGRGSNCIVYKCEDLTDKHWYIVKEFYPVDLQDVITRDESGDLTIPEEAFELFEEKKSNYDYGLMKHLNYYNADTKNTISAPCVFSGSIEGYQTSTLYFFEIQNGVVLSDLLNSNNKISITDSLNILYYICEAINTIHNGGIVGEYAYYLDCKPDNILVKKKKIGNGWDVCLLDFDTVKTVSEIQGMNTGDFLCFSGGYSSPEQLKGLSSSIGFYSDVYSIGAVFYRILTGEKVYDNNVKPDDLSCIKKEFKIEDIVLLDDYKDLQNEEFSYMLKLLVNEMIETDIEKRKEIFGNDANNTTKLLMGRIEELYNKSNDKEGIKTKKSKKNSIALIDNVNRVISIIFFSFVVLLVGIILLFIVDRLSMGKITYELGKDFYYSKYASTFNMEMAREFFDISMGNSNNDAYYFLGKLELRNNNNKEAIEYFEKGKDGSALAKVGLAEQYEKGNYGAGLEPDVKKSIELYEEAINDGCIEAYYNLAELQRQGKDQIDFDKNEIKEPMDYNEEEILQKYIKSIKSNLPNYKANSYIKIGNIATYKNVGEIENKKTPKDFYEEAINCFPQCTGDVYVLIAEYCSGNQTLDSDVANYYNKALDYYTEASKRGDDSATFKIGQIYEKEINDKWTLKDAYNQYDKAAEKGNTDAMIRIGDMYKEGIFLNADPDSAKEYYKKACEEGNVEAFRKIGNLYYYDKFDPKSENYREENFFAAIPWYEKGAKYGSGTCFYGIGCCMVKESDYFEAKEKFVKGASLGNSQCFNALGLYYEYDYLDEKKVDREKAKEYYMISSQIGDDAAMYNLGRYYYDEEDYKNAKIWFTKAALEKHSSSMYYLGLICMEECNVGDARDWFNEAALLGNNNSIYKLEEIKKDHPSLIEDDAMKELYIVQSDNGNVHATVMLADLYREDKSSDLNSIEARNLYEKAIENNSTYAMNNLGYMYDMGYFYGVYDHTMAKYWFEKAAENGESTAMRNLAFGYKQGDYGEKDYYQAANWFYEAASIGNEDCIDYLIEMFKEKKINDDNYIYMMNQLGIIYRERHIDDNNIDDNNMDDNIDFLDYGVSLKCYLEAANLGDVNSMEWIGYLYETGRLKDENRIHKAIEWYNKAKENGSTYADDALKRINSD